MDPDAKAALRILESLRPPARAPVDLDEAYLARVACVESLPQNQPGADKTWISRLIDADRRHFSHARRL